MELLNKVVPLKSTFLRSNHSKFVTKGYPVKNRTEKSVFKEEDFRARTKYNKQRNNCVRLVEKS